MYLDKGKLSCCHDAMFIYHVHVAKGCFVWFSDNVFLERESFDVLSLFFGSQRRKKLRPIYRSMSLLLSGGRGSFAVSVCVQQTGVNTGLQIRSWLRLGLAAGLLSGLWSS